MKTYDRATIIKLNIYLRGQYADASNIKHCQGDRGNETHLTTSQMPNTNKAGRILAGFTNDLVSEMYRQD